MSKERCGIWEEEEEGLPEIEVEEEDSISGKDEGSQGEGEGSVPADNLGSDADNLSPRSILYGVRQEGKCEETFLNLHKVAKDFSEKEPDVQMYGGQVSKLVEEVGMLESGGVCNSLGRQHTPRGTQGKVGGVTHQPVSSQEIAARVEITNKADATRVKDSVEGELLLLNGGTVVGPAEVLGGDFVGPCEVNGPLTHEWDLDSEETISDFTYAKDTLIHRRGRKKNSKKCKAATVGVPKCFQFAKAIMDGKGGAMRKGGLGEGSSKHIERPLERGDKELEESLGANDGGPGTSGSGLRLILEESGTVEPETPLIALPSTCRKELDASRIFSLQKYNGINFDVVDNSMVSKLADLQDIEVAKDDIREREMVSQ